LKNKSKERRVGRTVDIHSTEIVR